MHTSESTVFGMFSQPLSVGHSMYRIRMKKADSKKVLWENVSTLMKSEFGKENLTKLAGKAGFGPGTSTRLKGQETSVGTDILDSIAESFGIEPWQLLMPGLGTDSKAPAEGLEMPMVDRDRFAALPSDSRIFIQGYVTRLIEEQEQSITKRNGTYS